MSALPQGTTAPNFSLGGIDRNIYTLDEERKSKLVVAAFYKRSCPICQMTFPFLERIHMAYAGSNLKVLGIAQDEQHEAEEFASEYKLTFPIALDKDPYEVSTKYGITHVPTVFLISRDATIQRTLVGFDKQGLKDLSTDIARQLGRPVVEIFSIADNVPEYKPG
jgi:peroxiredoxin